MNIIGVLGWIAPAFFMIVFVPQAVKVVLSKKTTGLSGISYMAIYVGSTLYMLWGGVAEGLTLIQVFVSELIVSAVELIIIFYIFTNNKKLYIFYFALVWGIILFIIALVMLILPQELSSEGIAPISIIGGLLIAFAFMPQTIRALVKKEVKNISILTVLALGIATSLLGTYQLLHETDGPLSSIQQFEKIMGGSVEYLAAAWCVPQFILKVIDVRKIKKAHTEMPKAVHAIEEFAKTEAVTFFQKAAIYNWLQGHGKIELESFDQLADRLNLKHDHIDKIVKELSNATYKHKNKKLS